MKRIACALVAAIVALTACSSSGGGGAPLTDKFGLTQAGATKSLLTDSQLPDGLSVTKGDRTEVPMPCTPKAAPVSQQFHPRAGARVPYGDDLNSFQITEIVTNYSGTKTTAAVAATIVRGLGCETGYIGRFAVTISGPSQLTKLGIATDGAESWSLKAPGSEQVVMLVQIGTSLVQLLFASKGAVRAGIDPSAIAKQAVQNVKNTVGS